MHMKKGNALIITTLFTAIVSLIILGLISGCINNINRSQQDIYKSDLHSIDLDEEEVLRIFMNKINSMELEADKNKIVCEDFCLNEEGSRIYFVRRVNKFYMEYKNVDASRKIDYKIQDGKIILIPSYTRIVPKIEDYKDI